MEGLTAVTDPAQICPGTEEYGFGRRMLMHDLGAVVEGLMTVEGTQVVVYDSHAEGRNVDIECLPPGTKVISGRPTFEDNFCYGLDESFDAMFLVGAAASLGAPDAVLGRSYDDGIAAVRINGMQVGGIVCDAALAGEFGVPLAFVSSDAAGARETHELISDEVETVAVKQAVRETAAICLPPAQTREMLSTAAARALGKAKELPPLLFETPTRIEVTFQSPQGAASMEPSHTATRTGANSMEFVGERFLSAYRNFVLAHEHRGRAAPPKAARA